MKLATLLNLLEKLSSDMTNKEKEKVASIYISLNAAAHTALFKQWTCAVQMLSSVIFIIIIVPNSLTPNSAFFQK